MPSKLSSPDPAPLAKSGYRYDTQIRFGQGPVAFAASSSIPVSVRGGVPPFSMGPSPESTTETHSYDCGLQVDPRQVTTPGFTKLGTAEHLLTPWGPEEPTPPRWITRTWSTSWASRRETGLHGRPGGLPNRFGRLDSRKCPLELRHLFVWIEFYF